LSKPSFQQTPSSEAGCKSRKNIIPHKDFETINRDFNVSSWFSMGNIFRQTKTIMPFACLAPS
ncbi:hypothetical protein, partial [Pedobacter suwonensis]|uniref:hypothetical protein n=1 Tax=Pedobacter suwonensis TaxID=332999 RepID=UPI001AD7FCFC